jgi:Na+-driven multidrug efflux pump
MRVGLPRAIARVILLTSWVSISRLMTQKGGDYLMVLSVGGSLILLFTFVFDGMIQGLISIASHLMGAKEYEKIWRMVRSGLVFVLLIGAGLAFPYLIFQDFTLSFFFPTPPSTQTMLVLKKTCVWLWFFFVCNGVNAIGQSLVTASRDLTFLMCSISFVWLTSYVPTYLGMNVLHFSADKLWLLMSFDALIFGGLFILRGTREKWKNHDENFELG